MNLLIEFDIELLITLVESKPVLWDKESELYKDRYKTREAWKEICILFKNDFEGMSPKEQDKFEKDLIKKWTNIRNAFVRYRKKKKDATKSGAGTNVIKKYVYEKQLEFLTKIVDPRETQDSLAGDVEQVITIPDIVIAETDKEKSTPPVKSASKKRKMDEFEVQLLKAMDEKKPEDRYCLFIKSLLPILQEFTDEQYLQFQTSVIEAVNNIKRGSRIMHSGIPYMPPYYGGYHSFAGAETRQRSPNSQSPGSSGASTSSF